MGSHQFNSIFETQVPRKRNSVAVSPIFNSDDWIPYEEATIDSGRRRPSTYSLEASLRDCEYALEETEDIVLLLEGEKAKAIKEAEEAHSKMVSALAAQERAEKRAKAEKARAAELQKTALEAHSKMVEALAAQERAEQRAKAEKARVTELQKISLAEIRSAKKSSEQSLSTMITALEDQGRAERKTKAEKARADELEQALRKAEEAHKLSEEAHSKMIEALAGQELSVKFEARRREEKLQEELRFKDKKMDELVTGCAHLWECCHNKEKEVVRLVSEKVAVMEEKEELKVKVEELSKALEEAMARETSRLEEEYDKIEYEGLETWECCKVDDEESDSYPSS